MALYINDVIPTLASLPTELVHRISHYLPCTSALSLMSTNRHFHAVCKDRILFKSIAENTIYNWDWKLPDLNYERLVWKDAPVILDRASCEDLVRIAYAIERACLVADANVSRLHVRLHQGEQPADCDWLPHLFTLGHPACLLLDPRQFLDVQFELRDLVLGSNFAQCFSNASAAEFCTIALSLERHALGKQDYRDFLSQGHVLGQHVDQRELERNWEYGEIFDTIQA